MKVFNIADERILVAVHTSGLDEKVRAFATAAKGGDLPEWAIPFTQSRTFSRRMADGCASFLALRVGSEVIGHVYIWDGELGISVAETWQGKGVGSALLKTVLEWADMQKIQSLRLTVENERAKTLYRKFGFEDAAVLTVAPDGKSIIPKADAAPMMVRMRKS